MSKSITTLSASIQYGVLVDDLGTAEYYPSKVEADYHRSTPNGKLPLIQVIALVLDEGNYKEPEGPDA